MLVTRPVPFAVVVNAVVTIAFVVTRLVTSKTVVKKLVMVWVVTHVDPGGTTVVLVTEVDQREDFCADTLGMLVRVEPILSWEIELAVFDGMLAVVSIVVCVGPERFDVVLVVKELCALMELVGINSELIWRGIDLRKIIRVVVSMIVLRTNWVSMRVVTSFVTVSGREKVVAMAFLVTKFVKVDKMQMRLLLIIRVEIEVLLIIVVAEAVLPRSRGFEGEGPPIM